MTCSGRRVYMFFFFFICNSLSSQKQVVAVLWLSEWGYGHMEDALCDFVGFSVSLRYFFSLLTSFGTCFPSLCNALSLNQVMSWTFWLYACFLLNLNYSLWSWTAALCNRPGDWHLLLVLRVTLKEGSWWEKERKRNVSVRERIPV